MPDLTPWYDDDTLNIQTLEGQGPTLVVSFAGVGRRRQSLPEPEFVKIAHADGKHHVLFVADRSRCWLNHPDMLATIMSAVADKVRQSGAERVVAIGNSMGGTMALHLARVMHVDAVVSFVPQVSIDPDIVPEERRWMGYRRQIASYTCPQLTDLGALATAVFLLHGGADDEMPHARRFPQAPNIHHAIFPQSGHQLARDLKRSGDLQAISHAGLAGDRQAFHEAMRRAGGVDRAVFFRD